MARVAEGGFAGFGAHILQHDRNYSNLYYNIIYCVIILLF